MQEKIYNTRKGLAQLLGLHMSQIAFVRGVGQGSNEMPMFVEIRVHPDTATSYLNDLELIGLHPHPYPIKDGLLVLLSDEVMAGMEAA